MDDDRPKEGIPRWVFDPRECFRRVDPTALPVPAGMKYVVPIEPPPDEPLIVEGKG